MRRKSHATDLSSEEVVKDIRRATRKRYSAEEKIRIVLDGLRGEHSIAELCRREGIAEGLYYSWSKEFLEAGKRRLGSIATDWRCPRVVRSSPDSRRRSRHHGTSQKCQARHSTRNQRTGLLMSASVYIDSEHGAQARTRPELLMHHQPDLKGGRTAWADLNRSRR